MARVCVVRGRFARKRIRRGLRKIAPYRSQLYRKALNDQLQRNEVWCGRVDSNHHGIATASPSSWCVCQFRHDRTAHCTETALTTRTSKLDAVPY